MTRRLPITYRTFVHRKSVFGDNRQRFEAQLKRDIVNLLLAHLSDFHSYGTVKVYYDGGQQIVTDALRGGIEYALSIDAIVYRDASPRDYRLEQVADFGYSLFVVGGGQVVVTALRSSLPQVR